MREPKPPSSTVNPSRTPRPDESLDSSLFAAEDSDVLSDPLPIEEVAGAATEAPATPPRDTLFGKIAVQERFISVDQLAECVEIQKRSEPKVSLGKVMMDRGYVTALQIEVILDIQRVNMADRQVRPQEGGLFGHLAVAAGYCSREQIAEAIGAQQALRKSGDNVPIGRILLEAGRITREQVLDVLRRQERGAIRCDGCGATYIVEGLASGTRFACCRCYKVLAVPEGRKKTDRVAIVTHAPLDPQTRPLTESLPAPAPPAPAPPGPEDPADHLLLRNGGIVWPILYFALLMATWNLLGPAARGVFGILGVVLVAGSIWLFWRELVKDAREEASRDSLRRGVAALEERWAKLQWVWRQYGAWEKIGQADPKEIADVESAIRDLRASAAPPPQDPPPR